MGSRLLRAWGFAAAAVLPAILGTGCSTTDPDRAVPGAAPAAPRGSEARHLDLRKLLPAPLGSVTFRDDPVVFVLGWTGMIAGGVVGGAFMLDHSGNADSGGNDDLVVVGAVFGAVVGGCLLTAPVKGLEELWHWIFHGDATHPAPVGAEGP